MHHSNTRPRRHHDAEFKAQVLAACNEAGASVAAIAQAFALNANLVHKLSAVVSQRTNLAARPRFDERTR